MDEASMCDRVALMQNGAILSVDSPEGVIDAFKHPLVAVKDSNMLRLLNDLQRFEGVQDAYPFGEYHHVVLKDGFTANAVTNYLQQHSYQQPDVKTSESRYRGLFYCADEILLKRYVKF